MRKALSIGVVVTCMALALGLTAWWLVQRALTAAGIEELEWQGLRLSGVGLQLQTLSGRYRDSEGELRFDVSGLRLQLGGESRLRLREISAERVDLDWHPNASETSEPGPGVPDPLAWAESLNWLPDSLHLQHLQVTLPCPAGDCRAEGELDINRVAADQFALHLALNTGAAQLEVQAEVQQVLQGLAVQAQVQVNEAPALALETRWLQPGPVPQWQGRLQVPEWPAADWLIDYVAPWRGHQGLSFEQLPTGLQADLVWDLSPAKPPVTWLDFLGGAVQLQASARVPNAWYWPELGHVLGTVELDVQGDHGRWQLREGLASLVIEQPTLTALAELPDAVRPTRVSLRVQPDSGSQLDWETVLPLALQADIAGPLELSLAGRIVLASQPLWQAEWESLVLTGRSARLGWDGLQAQGLSLSLPLAGRVDAEQLSARLGGGARVRINSLTEADIDLQLRGARVDLAGLQLQVPLADPALTSARGRLNISLDNLAHPLLKPQGWSLNGELRYAAERIGWQGSAQAGDGLGLDLELSVPGDGPWRAQVGLQEVFLRAANPLAATFADWPALLSFGSGRLTGEFQAGGDAGLDQVQGQLRLSGGKGIYDRATFEGLNGTVNVALKGESLHLHLPDLQVEALNPGMPLGPLSLDIDYRAALSDPARGQVEVLSAQMGMLGGQLRLAPAKVDLKAPRQSLVVEMTGVELARLFEVYPAEGLSGRGTLDGRLPISLDEGKWVIDSGQLRAREPGGYLRYRSDKLKDLAQTNAGMRQVAEALDDFHYTVMASDVDYDQQGVLVLGLQLQGSNPSLQGGRPIRLNVRLEEDIPALLASLQLSGQVSEVIQKRVQERLLQRRLGPDR